MAERKTSIKSFCVTMGTGLAATAVSVSFAGGLAETVAVVTAVALLWCLPWRRWPMARFILQLAAGLGCLYLGLIALGRSIPAVSWVQWCLGWGILWLMLCYFGQKALYEASILTGGLAAGVMLFFSAASVFVGWRVPVISFGTLPFLPLGVLLLLGCALTGREVAGDDRASFWGGMAGFLIWGITSAIPSLVWSRPALSLLPFALPAAWGRIQILGLIHCPDVLLCALSALLCLWQNALFVGTLKSILYKRRSL
ncbi:MAG: hypothetical protein IJN42_07465 [Clostridia bacterium]|nr:hypothetical protein [Clostridia bacterium]